MRRPLLLALSFVLAATAAMAASPVLTADGALYSVDAGERDSLTITRRIDGRRYSLTVPTTDDPALDSDASLTYDHNTDVLFVTWRRSSSIGDEVRIASMDRNGRWSEPVTIASNDSSIRIGGLQTSHTNASDDFGPVTLVHAAWWRQSSRMAAPHYALVAFSGQQHVSTAVAPIEDLAGVRVAVDEAFEDVGAAKFPPLAIDAIGQEADVVYGDTFTTKLTRVRVVPRVVVGNARLWRPVGKDGRRMPSARLISSTAEPVQAFISGNRVVLYTHANDQFRYVVFSGSAWSPVRHLALDGTLTPEAVVMELRNSVERWVSGGSDLPKPGM